MRFRLTSECKQHKFRPCTPIILGVHWPLSITPHPHPSTPPPPPPLRYIAPVVNDYPPSFRPSLPSHCFCGQVQNTKMVINALRKCNSTPPCLLFYPLRVYRTRAIINPTCYTTATCAITRTNTLGILLCCCAEVPGARYTAAHTGAEPPGLPESESSSIIGTS